MLYNDHDNNSTSEYFENNMPVHGVIQINFDVTVLLNGLGWNLFLWMKCCVLIHFRESIAMNYEIFVPPVMNHLHI